MVWYQGSRRAAGKWVPAREIATIYGFKVLEVWVWFKERWRGFIVRIPIEKDMEVWTWIGTSYSENREQPEETNTKDDKGRRSKGSRSRGSRGAKLAKSEPVKKQLADKTTKSK